MTPDLPTRIHLVLAECERIIAASEKATDGPWAITHREPRASSRAPRNIIGPIGSTFEPGVKRTCIAAPHRDEDADLIVSSRTFCPAAAVGYVALLKHTHALELTAETLDRLTSPFAYLWT